MTGATRLCAVIGDPVRHSQSPRLHNAAYAALGLDRIYVALEVPAGHGRAAVRSIVELGIDGLNVTMPHKEDAAAACDELTPDAAALRSVNTVVRRPDGTLLGASTDGEGFLRSISAGRAPQQLQALAEQPLGALVAPRLGGRHGEGRRAQDAFPAPTGASSSSQP